LLIAGAAPVERTGRGPRGAVPQSGARQVRGPVLIVRANALNSGETDSDLDAVMPGAADAILLPGSLGATSVQQLSAKLAVREAEFDLPDGETRIIAVADTAQSLFQVGSYRGSSGRLIAVAWSAEALRADIAAETDRYRLGHTLGPYRLSRDLTLFSFNAAATTEIYTVFLNIRDMEGLRAEAMPRGVTALPARSRSICPGRRHQRRLPSRSAAGERTPRNAVSLFRPVRGFEPRLLNHGLCAP
jgi:citrate lyase beta subunit